LLQIFAEGIDKPAAVLFYLVRLADVLKVDLNEAVTQKLKNNALLYVINLINGGPTISINNRY
jgi:hypothetical protein